MYLCGKPVEAGGPVLAHRSHAWKPDSTGGHSLKNGKPVCAGGPVLDLREALQEGGPVIELDEYAWRPDKTRNHVLRKPDPAGDPVEEGEYREASHSWRP